MQKLPSGSYKQQIYLGKIDGKRKYKTVTARTRSELRMKIAAIVPSEKHRNGPEINYKDAAEQLLASKGNVLSANTLKGYKTVRNSFKYLDDMNVNDITASDMQSAINKYAEKHSPHTCANAYSFAMTVIRSVIPEAGFKIKLPQKKKYEALVPTKEDINLLIKNAEGKLKPAIMLAAFGPMRRGEVAALKYKDIKKDTVHVHATITQDEGYAYKDTPKSTAGDRYIEFPHDVIKELGKGKPEEYVIGIDPENIYFSFRRLCKSLGLPPYRFHDLRVFGASYLHSLGYSNAFIMERGGWDTEAVLVEIYRKSMSDESKRLTEAFKKEVVGSFFS